MVLVGEVRLRLSAIFTVCSRKVIILRNVIQVVFLIFNHVERIWHRPLCLPLSLSRSACVCVTKRGWGLRNEEKEEEGQHCAVEWRKRKKKEGGGVFSCVRLCCMVTFYSL